MIKVIQNPVIFENACQKCFAVLHYDYTEVRAVGGIYAKFEVIDCPVCNSTVYHDKAKKCEPIKKS